MILTILLCSIFALLPGTVFTQSKGWRGIAPLHSTRADVERLLGPPIDPDKEYVSVHKLENEVVFIVYASGPPCGMDAQRMWKVPRGTVVSITTSPKTKIRFSELQIDENKYRKTDGGHVPGYTYYINEEDGLKFEVIKDEVASITYFPSAKDNSLRCPTSATQEAVTAGSSRATQDSDSTGPTGDVCPTIFINKPSGDMCRSQRASFSAVLAGSDPRFSPIFKWSVSAGTIISGQGTYAIEVDPGNAGGKPITVTLEVGGDIPEGCPKVVCYTTECLKPSANAQK